MKNDQRELWNKSLTEQLESAKASIKQLKKQWDEHELSILCCDQRRHNFQEVYSTKNFEQAQKIEILEKKVSDLENETFIGKGRWIEQLEGRIEKLEKKMGIVDDHV